MVQADLANCRAPIPVPFKNKIPVLDEARLRLTPETVTDYFNGNPQNVGLLLGETSHGLTDMDLDCRRRWSWPRFSPRRPAYSGA